MYFRDSVHIALEYGKFDAAFPLYHPKPRYRDLGVTLARISTMSC